MIVTDWLRLVFYLVASVVPIWSAYFTTSTDYSVRGLAIPILASVNAMVVVLLARTKSPSIDAPGTITITPATVTKEPNP